MGQLHKSVALLLGDRVQDLHPMLEERVERRQVEDGGRFPNQLLGVLPFTNHDLAQGVDEYSHDLERMLNRVNDALGIMQLTKERGISVEDFLLLQVVVPSCDSEGRQGLFDVIEQIHHICQANKFLFRINAFILMPGLFGDDEDADPTLYRARALSTLHQLDQIMRSDQEPWRDNAPLNNIWLVDSRNERGEFIGYLPQALEMISEMIVSMASDDLEGLNEGASRSSEGRFFRSFGFSEVWLPLEVLQQQIADHFVSHALAQDVVPDKRIHSNELLLSVKQYCHQEFPSVDSILERIGANPDGSSYFEPFDIDIDDEELSIDAYLNLFREKVEQYDGDTALQAKRKLHERAEEEMGSVFASIRQKLDELIDEHPNGTLYAQAFLEELLGKGDESELTEGPRFDEPTNLANRQEDLFARFVENLGIPAYRSELQEVNERLTELRSEKQSLEAEKQVEATIKPADDEDADEEATYVAGGEDVASDKDNTRLQEIEGEIERLESRRDELEELVRLSQDAAEDVEVSQSLRQKAEYERRSYLKDIEQRLRQAGQSLQQARDRLSYLHEERPHAQRRYFIHYPIGFVGGLLFALAYLIFADYISFPGFLANQVTWQIITVFVLVFGIFVLWRYYSSSLSHINRTRAEINQLNEQIRSLKADLRRGFRELYDNIFTQYRDQVALNEFHNCFADLNAKHDDIRYFNDMLKTWGQKLDFPELDSHTLTNIPLLSADQFQKLATQFIIEDELVREVERALSPSISERHISDLVWHGEDGASELIRSLQEWGGELAERKLQGLGVEEVLFDDRFAELREQANLDPHEIVKLLTQIAPALQVDDEVGGGADVRHEIGVADVERSWLQDYLDPNHAIYSHYDLSRITSFSYINPVPLNSLSKLGYFCESLNKVLDGHSDDLNVSQEQLDSLQEFCEEGKAN